MVFEDPPQLADGPGHHVVADEAAAPDLLDELLARDHLTPRGGERDQHVHGLGLELVECSAGRDQPIELRLHAPAVEQELVSVAFLGCRFLIGHGRGAAPARSIRARFERGARLGESSAFPRRFLGRTTGRATE
jgi:hypothetical protein